MHINNQDGTIVGVGFQNPMTTAGDLIVGGAGGAATRVQIGARGAALRSDGAMPYWEGLTLGAYAWWTSLAGVNTGQTDVWTDSIGGYALQQASAGQRPTYTTSGGVVCLDFDGADDYLATPSLASHDPDGLSTLTIQALVSVDVGDDGQTDTYVAVGWPESTTWGRTWLSPRQNRIRWRFATTAADNNPSQSYSSRGTAWFVATIVKDGTSEYAYTNGTQVYAGAAANAGLAGNGDTLRVGGSSPGTNLWNGRLAEVVIYKAALNAGQVAANVAFFAARHNLSLA